MHQLWQAVVLKPLKLGECILYFWKPPIFINLVPAGQGHSSLWDKMPIPPTFYGAAPSRCIKPYSNESFDGMLQIKTGVKLVADQRMC